MLTLSFTAAVVKKDKGQYIAHAAEFPVTGDMASTQRGAILKLRAAVYERLYKAGLTIS
jgi:hypothetical protein